MENLSEYNNIIKKLEVLRIITPRAEFRSRFEDLLVPSLPQKKTIHSVFFGYAFRLVLIIVLFIAFGSTGIVLAAEHAKPGSLLYPVKQIVQNAKIAVATNPSTKALLHMEKAGDKINEIQESVHDQKPDQLEQNAQEYSKNIDKAVGETQKIDDQNSEKEGTVKIINSSLEKHTETLQQLQTVAPTQAQNALGKAIEASKNGKEEVEKVIGTTSTPVPQSQEQNSNKPENESGFKPTQLPNHESNNQGNNSNNSQQGRQKAEEIIINNNF